LVNEVAVAMFLGLLGIKATLIYAVSGIFFGTISVFIILLGFLFNWIL